VTSKGDRTEVTFGAFLARVTTTHVVTYFVAGLLALTFLDYRTLFQSDVLSCFMRPVSSPWVAAGPALQVVRGLIFATVLYPFRSVFLRERGWLPLWGLLLGLAIFSTVGPSPGSVEGFIYTRVTPAQQLLGLPEGVLQTLAFSALLSAWCRRPHRAWPVVMACLSALDMVMSAAGLFLAPGSQ
jgi:hypothetical protein